MARNIVIRSVGAFFKKLSGQFRQRFVPTPVQEEMSSPAASEDASVPESPYVRRIIRVMSACEVSRRRGGATGVWTAKAQGYADAYRFMLRLCGSPLVKVERRSGHVCHKAVFPDGTGSILLSEKVGYRRGSLAVMRLDVSGLPDVLEIRFSASVRS